MSLYYLFGIPALLHHEYSHLLMCYLLRVKVLAFKINVDYNNNITDWSGSVTNEPTHVIKKMLITVAPFLTTLMGAFGSMLLMLISPIFILLVLYILIYLPIFSLSEGDIDNFEREWKELIKWK